MRKTLKKALTLVTALTMTLSMSSLVSAADDIVLDGAGDPLGALIGTIAPSERSKPKASEDDKEEYQYIHWVDCRMNADHTDLDSSYKYLKLTYHGDKDSMEQIRLELVAPDGNPDGPGINTGNIIWFSENEEGTFKTVDGDMVPAPTDKDQTVVIDLEKSGYNLSDGIRAFHIHSSKGYGALTITDAVLMTSAGNGSSDKGSTDTKKDNNSSKEEATTAAANSTTGGGATTGGGSTAAPKTGSTTTPIAVAIGGIVVAGAAFAVSKKLKED